jgi:putative IMPACT (imprinted ancient) family translation regulator
MLELPYQLLERIRLLVAANDGRILDESFAATVILSAQFLVERFAPFAAALRELSQGQIEATIIETNEATIMPE